MIQYFIVVFIAITVFRYDLFLREIMTKSCATLPFPDFTVSILGAWALELGLPLGGVAENPF